MLNLTKLSRSTRNLFSKSICAYATNSTASSVPEKTSLYDFHVANNGKMVDFAGEYLNENVQQSHK